MRFHFGSIPASPDFVPESPWRPCREPSPWLLQVIAAPVGLGTAAVLFALWVFVTPLSRLEGPSTPTATVLLIVGVIVVHELLHAAAHPKFGFSRHSVVGFWPWTLMFYAHYDGELGRNRFITIFLVPLIVISVVPLVLAAVFRLPLGTAAQASVLNGLFACGDVIGAIIIWWQVPPTAIARNQGWRTYWRPEETPAEAEVVDAGGSLECGSGSPCR
jgi:hypothetical protein